MVPTEDQKDAHNIYKRVGAISGINALPLTHHSHLPFLALSVLGIDEMQATIFPTETTR